MKTSRNNLRIHRKQRVRSKINGTQSRPRVSVFRSLKKISVQVIDDLTGNTLAYADSNMAKAKNDVKGAGEVGKLIAKECLAKKIESVVFDRSGYKYHGKVKALAEGAREGGLKF